jgi:23S rRNA (cytosine1962-C5)-methyltransferase
MNSEKSAVFNDILARAVKHRSDGLDAAHTTAVRLFNGFYEGCPELVVDLYARTLVLYGYASSLEESLQHMAGAQELLLARLPWVRCAIQKIHSSPDPLQRRGQVTYGSLPDSQVQQDGLWYALDLLLNQDASLYLDTRSLRRWLLEHSAGWSVLNTFAYTGTLGVAALAGGATRVVQVDRSRKFLELSRRSCMLNHLDLGRMKLSAVDFFSAAAHYKRTGELFDCAIIDPPYFSTTDKGTVHLTNESVQVINKLRPLIKDGGLIVAINNALFLKGADYMASLEQLCQDGYLAIETIIPVLPDFTGYPDTIIAQPPANPAPFNHPTKIVILRVKRKCGIV